MDQNDYHDKNKLDSLSKMTFILKMGIFGLEILIELTVGIVTG